VKVAVSLAELGRRWKRKSYYFPQPERYAVDPVSSRALFAARIDDHRVETSFGGKARDGDASGTAAKDGELGARGEGDRVRHGGTLPWRRL
jgi:hypothetical protein